MDESSVRFIRSFAISVVVMAIAFLATPYPVGIDAVFVPFLAPSLLVVFLVVVLEPFFADVALAGTD